MAIIFTQTDSAGACNLAAEAPACSGRGAANVPYLKSATVGGTAGTVESFASNEFTSQQTNVAFYLTECIVPAGATWDAGTLTARINVTTSNMNIDVTEVHVCRVNSTCVSQELLGSATGLSIGLNTTGVKSQNVTIIGTTPNAGDTLAVVWVGTNGAMSNQGVGITPDQNIDSPFTGVVTHATSGALAGPGADINGTSLHNKPHATSGVLTGPGSVLDGTAAHIATHATSGVLSAGAGTITGAAARTRVHATTGVLAGPGSDVTGAADRATAHATTGALAGPGAVVAGTASRTHVHPTTGVLAGAGSDVTGAALRERLHTSTGVLVGAGSTVTGEASRASSGIAHDTSGAMVAQGAEVSGTSEHNITHDTSGAIAGQAASVTGASAVSRTHVTTGDLAGQGSAVAGAAVNGGSVVDTTVKTGTGGIDPKRRRRTIYKPTGLVERPVKKSPTIEERIEAAREIEAEVIEESARKEEVLVVRPISAMSQEQIDFEIGTRLRELHRRLERDDDEETMILMLMVM